jgi:uncharacterized protein
MLAADPDAEVLRIPIAAGSGRLDNLVVKIAELCNLNCQYCYIYNHQDRSFRHRPKFMSDQVYLALLDRIGEYCDARPGHRMHITFHGGEPTLVGPNRLRWLAAQARDVLGTRLGALLMQTNGTLINDAWIDALIDGRVHTSVSLDGPAHIHDRERIDHLGRGSHAGAVRGLRLLQDAGLRPGVIGVVTPGQDGRQAYQHFRELGITSIDFLLPDITHDTKAFWYAACGARPVADFLIPAFDAWFDEDDPAVMVRIFHGLLSRMMGGAMLNDAFGNPRQAYLIIETDGSIQPLDALRACEDGMTATEANVRAHRLDDLAVDAPLAHQLMTEITPLSAVCQRCPELHTCGGGYLPHRFSKANGFDNPSAWCEDILALLAHMRARTNLTRTAFPGVVPRQS